LDPHLAAEKLAELHGLVISKETLRYWMRASGLWATRKDRAPAPHQPRFRRSAFGELVQIDGCEHHWFEDRGPYCTLLVFVDDATGKLMELLFVRAESAFGYFAATASYLRRHGKPVAFYSDKHSIFRVAREGSLGTHRGVSQFGRALGELNVDIICANSPQAKGRVERMNLTLQDRLVKELRLRGISTMDAGNAFAPEFMEDFNRRFAKPPRSPHDAHRPLLPTDDLDRIFCTRVARSMTPNMVVHFERSSYLITPTKETRGLAGRRRAVEVHRWADGRLEIHCNGQSLPYTVSEEPPAVSPGEVVERKRVAEVVSLIEEQQRQGGLRRPGQLRLRDKPALPSPSPASRGPDETITEVIARAADVGTEAAKRFVLRWVRRRAYLYARSTDGSSRSTGRPILKDKLLGEVDAVVAEHWLERGDWSVPPPLTAHPSEPRRSRSEEPAAAPAPAQPVDGLKRLNAALWFTDTFHAAEVERIRTAQRAADEAFAVQFSDEPPGAARRKPPKSSPRRVGRGHRRKAAAAVASRPAASSRR
jgi:hypothetical protein